MSKVKTHTEWVYKIKEAHRNVDKTLRDVCYNANKIQTIATQMNEFSENFEKLGSKWEPSIDQNKQLESYCQACVEFLKLCSHFSTKLWFAYFLTHPVCTAFEELYRLWKIWQKAVDSLSLSSFSNDDAIMYSHCHDLLQIYRVLASESKNIPIKFKHLVYKRSKEIECIIGMITYENKDNTSYILKHTEWTPIKENIGVGGYASVHLARMKSTGQLVAVKELKAGQLTGLRVVYMKREIDALMKLDHPNVLKLIGVTVTPPFCIVTNYVPNGCLSDIIHTKTPSPIDSPLLRSHVALDTARAMEYVHALGLVHRDLKPPNILLDENNNVVLCDFGISRLYGSHMTCGLGTVQWMAPEMITNGSKYNQSVDVYAYGIVLYELLTSQIPYQGNRQVQTANLVLRSGLRPTIPDDCPADFAELMKACWHEKPKKRPTFEAVRKKLESGECLLPGTDKEAFLKYVSKTKQTHEKFMKAVEDKKTAVQLALERLKTLSVHDQMTIASLSLLIDNDINIDDYVEKVAQMTIDIANRNLAVTALTKIAVSAKSDPYRVAVASLQVFDVVPEVTLEIVKIVSPKLHDKLSFVKKFLSPGKPQTTEVCDLAEVSASLQCADYVFDNLDERYVIPVLNKYVDKFGARKELLKSSFATLTALRFMIKTLTESGDDDEMFGKDVPKLLGDIIFEDDWEKKEELVDRAIDILMPIMKEVKCGKATTDIINYGAKYPKILEKMKTQKVDRLILEIFKTFRKDALLGAIQAMKYFDYSKEDYKEVYENCVTFFEQSRSPEIFDFAVSLSVNDNSIETGRITRTVIERSNELDLMKKLLTMRHNLTVDEEFASAFAVGLGKAETDGCAAISILMLKLVKEGVRIDRLLSPAISFLYSRRPAAVVAIPMLSAIKAATNSAVVVKFLVQQNFVLFLHQLPMMYPGDSRVGDIVKGFAKSFERYVKV